MLEACLQVLAWAYQRDSRLQPSASQLQHLRETADKAGKDASPWELLGDVLAGPQPAGQAFDKTKLHHPARVCLLGS